MNRALLIIIPFSLLLALIQSSFFARITFLGHIPQLIVLLAVAWAILRDLPEGLLWGLIGGLSLDLYSAGPIGTNAMAIMAAVALAYGARQLLPRGQNLIPALLGTVGSVVYLAVQAFLIQLGGFTPDWAIFQELPSYMILHGLLMVPLYWLTVGVTRVLYPEPIRAVDD